MASGEELSVTLDERKLYGEITVTVKIRRDWRCRVGLWLAKLAGWVGGFAVEAEWEEERT